MNKKTYLKSVIFILTLFFSFSLSAQSEPEVIKDWTTLEEAEFMVDVSYQIIKCSSDSNAEILLNVFNEAGIKTNFGITLHFTDNSNIKKDVSIALNVPQGDMWIASCENNKYPKLKFQVPDGIDADSLVLTITYN